MLFYDIQHIKTMLTYQIRIGIYKSGFYITVDSIEQNYNYFHPKIWFLLHI